VDVYTCINYTCNFGACFLVCR